eukprot:GSChrysophyteH2.ASY1.ANO1.957.1 assembled CDS
MRLSRPAVTSTLRNFANSGRCASVSLTVNADLADTDPELLEIIRAEQVRQKESLALIPSENFTSKSVMQALGSCMSNKYSEGYPGARCVCICVCVFVCVCVSLSISLS